MKHLSFLIFSLILCIFASAKKPNFVFLVSEDNSIHYLKHYGAKFGSMPNVEKMAEEGLTFNHAFSNAPVCSVARSTLATGILAPRGGFQYHRKAETATLPNGVLPWSAILRDAGYFCANNRKLDYNFKYAIPWTLFSLSPPTGNSYVAKWSFTMVRYSSGCWLLLFQ